ncbi:hypothetical protein AB0I28_34190 [Phytomonospora sp. NPDC050363]|uniref:hypothetical protein n=1 Tax=Phytomonospora sp. NPDC050363 TaxID=3155642 RepID=UPI00340AFA34
MSNPRARWIPIAAFTAALVAVYVIAAFVMSGNDETDADGDTQLGIAMIAVIAAIAIAAGVWWGRRGSVQNLIADAGLGVVVAGVLAVVLGPVAAGRGPFENGLGDFLVALLTFWAVAVIGVFIGLMALTLFAADYRSRQLKNTEKYYSRKKPVKRR